MEPRIQYAKTEDGVSIAYWTMGEGIPFIYMPPGAYSHIEMEWQLPEARPEYEYLAEKRMLVRYDGRGQGLSDRDATDFSVEARMLDLAAVVDRLGTQKFALYAPFYAGPAAITYAVRHPERVSHLLLWCCWARGSDLAFPELQVLGDLAAANWELFTETVAHAFIGWSEGEPARRFATLMRESITPEALSAYTEEFEESDVTNLLSEVRSPTLVLHRRQVSFPQVDAARGLAARISDARLVLLEGRSMACYLGDMEAAMQAIDEFLAEGEEAETGGLSADIVHTILFTDVEGSTALTDRLGDAKARELLREHERMVREALKSHGGSEVKALGDGFMTSFSSATKALECAIAMQRAFAQRNESAEEPIRVRIGLNAGEPIAEDDPDGRSDLFGTAVNLAARIAAQAEGGEILASEAVRQIVAGKKFPFSDRGETALRGFEDRVHIYQVSWRGED
jgi:class 3 adenylate cyclase